MWTKKMSIVLPEEVAEEIKQEAERQDRSMSWILQQAWRIAQPQMLQFPSIQELTRTQ